MSQTVPASSASLPPTATGLPYNRLGLDYRRGLPQKVSLPGGIVDAHTHVHLGTGGQLARTFVEAADVYGIGPIWTMTPLEEVDALNAQYPGRFSYIAVPHWQSGGATEEFISDWMRRLDAFYLKGSRIFKLHMAPGTKKRWSMDFRHPLIHRIMKHAYELGYHFMSHVADPKDWFVPPARYSSVPDYGTFDQQFTPLEEVLAQFPDRIHLGAHMGGSLEDLPALTARMHKYPNYILDTSATKWIIRAIAQQPTGAITEFFTTFQDRIIFGSDLVIGDKLNFDHYASRYWVQRMQWESDYSGPSPIEDPDAPNQDPRLLGLNLPAEVLTKIYRTNALRWLPTPTNEVHVLSQAG